MCQFESWKCDVMFQHFTLKDYLHLKKYNSKGTSKDPIFKLFRELAKIWKCSLGFSKAPIFHSFYELGKTTFQNPNFESVDELGKAMS